MERMFDWFRASKLDFHVGSEPFSQLCRLCRDVCKLIPTAIDKAPPSMPHHVDEVALQASADEGCALCALFLLDRRLEHMNDAYRNDEADNFSALTSGYVVMYSNCSRRRGYSYTTTCELILRPQALEPYDEMRFNTDLRSSTVYAICKDDASGQIPSNPHTSLQSNTASGLELLSKWYTTCNTTHELCRVPQTTLPTRLVFIGDDAPRLEIAVQMNKNPVYATLSHCWGLTNFPTLKKANFESFQKEIPKEAISASFRDAIYVARSLKLDYIWIDSLCIIQDDPEDWRKESSLMCDIYGGSTINIAASGAKDGNGGCFFDRNTPLGASIKAGKNIYDCVPAHHYGALSNSPLLKRAWTLQERMLPQRTIHFTRHELFWECHESMACETFPDSFPEIYRYLYHNEISPEIFTKEPVDLSMWMWIVGQYSRCALTKGSDKLVAISGIARQVQQRTQDQYLAGLWRTELEKWLCWYVPMPSENETSLNAPYRAPSWSWACQDRIVAYPKSLFNQPYSWLNLKTVDAQTTPIGEDPLGGISAGYIHIACHCIFRAKLDTTLGATLSEMGWTTDDGIKTRVNIFMDDTPVYPVQVWVLPFGGKYHNESTDGIFLASTGLKSGQYRRIGFFMIWQQLDKDGHTFARNRDKGCQGTESDFMATRTDVEGRVQWIIEII